MQGNYKVYVHVFPNGKRYVGCTKSPLKTRWIGGLGYENQKLEFAAILQFGWNNIRHYVLMDNLTKAEAQLYEAAFIFSWQTHKKGKGYNMALPKIDGAEEINVPNFKQCKKTLIKDVYEEDVRTRLDKKYLRENRNCKKVRCIETGKIYNSADEASFECHTGKANSIQRAVRLGCACGTCEIYTDECGWFETPAHWEYADV